MIRVQNLNQMFRCMGKADAAKHITESLRAGELKPADFSLRDLAEACFGHEFVRACKPGDDNEMAPILEAEGVSSSAFSNITGQVFFSRVMEAFQSAGFVVSGLVPTIPTSLSGEKIPGITQLGTGTAGGILPEVMEGMPYPHYGIGEEYIDTPPTRKYGPIVPVTREAVYFDRTGLLLQRAAQVGEACGLTKEILLTRAVGETASSPAFVDGAKWKFKGTEYSTYNSTTVDWVSYWYLNKITDVLTDHTDVDAALLVLGEAKDPNTRHPIVLAPQLTLLTVPALAATAWRVANATEIRTTTGGSAYQSITANRFGSSLTPVESRYLQSELAAGVAGSAAAARTYWYLGDFGRAFAWMENWSITTSEAPATSDAAFDRDILYQFKATMRGVPATIAPQYVVMSTGGG